MNPIFSWPVGLFILFSLVVYWGVLKKQNDRLIFLSLSSLGLITYLQPIAAIAVALVCFATYRVCSGIQRNTQNRGALLIYSILLIVGIIAYGKYSYAIVSSIFPNWSSGLQFFVQIFGVSYFSFKALQCVFDTYRGSIENITLARVSAFLFFFPIFPSGPIETYQGFFERQQKRLTESFLLWGLSRFFVGYAKKFLLLDYFFLEATQKVRSLEWVVGPDGEMNPLMSAAFGASTYIYAYLDLSAYTDMAIGISALFGFRIMENFRYPLFQRNLAEFWRSWHISLSNWVQNQIYFPVFGLTRKIPLALYASMITMGLWHHVSLSWTAWGAWHATGLVALARWDRFKRKKKRLKKLCSSRLFKLGSWALTFFYVSLGYCFVGIPEFSKALQVFAAAALSPISWLWN